MKLTKPVLFLEEMNSNSRMYTTDNVITVCEKFNAKVAKDGPILGQLGYPDNFYTTASGKVSHIITKLYIEENVVMAEIELLPTTLLIPDLLNEVVFRTRGIGGLNEKNEVDLIEIVAIDAIPKGEDAFTVQQKEFDKKNK